MPDVTGASNNITEDKITDKCFELIGAFDEVKRSYPIIVLVLILDFSIGYHRWRVQRANYTAADSNQHGNGES